jgi:hypothetical protein
MSEELHNRPSKDINLIDTGEIGFYLTIMLPKKIREYGKDDFIKKVNELFAKKKYTYYFHLNKLINFPDNYKVGYGRLHYLDYNPSSVQNYSLSLMVEKKPVFDLSENDWELLSQEKSIIFRSPQKGMWFSVSVEGFSGHYMAKNAFNVAETSLDILRFVLGNRKLNHIDYGITYDPSTDYVQYAGSISMTSQIEYDNSMDKEIELFTELLKSPNKMEKRILQALKLIRIGDLFAEDSNKIFYFTAALEKLILDNRPEIKHKFSTRGAFLLSKSNNAREYTFDILKQIYDQRSTVAHGSENEYNYNLTNESKALARLAVREILSLMRSQGIVDVYHKDTTKSLSHYIESKMWGVESNS